MLKLLLTYVISFISLLLLMSLNVCQSLRTMRKQGLQRKKMFFSFPNTQCCMKISPKRKNHCMQTLGFLIWITSLSAENFSNYFSGLGK